MKNNKNKLLRVKEKFDKLFEEKIRNIENGEALSSVSNMPFYKVKNLFEGITERLYESNANKHFITDYMKAIRRSDSLTHMYRINETVNKNGISEFVDGSLYLSEAIKLFSDEDKSELRNSLNELRKIVKECVKKISLGKEEIQILSEGNNALINESLDYVLNYPKTSSNLSNYLVKFTNVAKHLNENKKIVKEEGNLIEGIKLDNLINEDMENWEKQAIKDISMTALSGEDKSSLFEAYKNDCISSINETIESNDTENKSRMESMRLQLESKKYNEENYIDDILKLAELKETLL